MVLGMLAGTGNAATITDAFNEVMSILGDSSTISSSSTSTEVQIDVTLNSIRGQCIVPCATVLFISVLFHIWLEKQLLKKVYFS